MVDRPTLYYLLLLLLYMKDEETNSMRTLSCKVKEDFKQSIDIYIKEESKKLKKNKEGGPKKLK